MLDLLLGYGISYSDYYTGWNTTTGADGKPADYINYTTSILTGGATTCILPPLGGRSATIGGSDLKIVVDWMGMLALLGGDGAITANPKSISIGKSILGWPLGPPAGTSTDFIFGEKNGINYGRARDTTITRKKSPTFEIKTIKSQNSNLDAPLFSPGHKALIGLPYLAIIALYTTSRALVLFGSANSTIIQHANISLANLTPRLQSTWIATMLAYERLMAVEKQLKDIKHVLKSHVGAAAEGTQNFAERMVALTQNTLISQQLTARITAEQDKARAFLADSKDIADDNIIKASSFLKNVSSLLEAPTQDVIVSNQNLVSYYNSLTFSTAAKIELQATKWNGPGETSQSTIKLTPTHINAISIAGKNEVASLKIGPSGDNGGKVEIKVPNNDKSRVSIGLAGKNLSGIEISNKILRIEGGTVNDKNSLIELSDKNLIIRCGPALTGPQILLENDKVTITAGNQTLGTGPKFVMTKDSIELTVGAITEESSLKISPKGIDIECGLFTSTNWNSKGITQSVAENRLQMTMVKLEEKVAMLQAKVDAVTKLESVLSNLDTAAIEKLKSALRNFL